MGTPIDAIAAYDDGTLRAITRGRVNQLIREGHVTDILTEVAVPIAQLSEILNRIGETQAASDVLAHAVHDGIKPSVLAQAVALITADKLAPIQPNTSVSVGPLGQVRVGPPPAATNAASTQELANWLRDHTLS